MKKITFVFISVFIFILIAGCSRVWNAANRSSLKTDIETMLLAADIQAEIDYCEMIKSTRAGYCTLLLTSQQADRFSETMNLSQPISDIDHDLVRNWTADGGCSLQDGFSEGETVHLFSSQQRNVEGPEQLGDGLEYLILFYHAESGQACIQLSYAYG